MESPTNQSAPSRSIQRTAILVLGMHRSGTSSLTRIINLHGVAVSANLEPANEFNERGYWESREIMAIHDRLLEQANSSWKDCGRFPQSWLDAGLGKPFIEELSANLERDFKDSPLFLVKDPRICRLMPLWTRLLADIGARPVVVIPFRNPAEVAQSLDRRDQMHQQRSLALWLRHVLDAEKNSRGLPRTFVNFQSLLDDWQAAIERLRQDLDIILPFASESVCSEVEGELSGNLKHFTTSKARIGRSLLAKLAIRAYDTLVQLEQGEIKDPAGIFDAIGDELAPITESLGPVLIDLDHKLKASRSETERSTDNIKLLQDDLAAAKDQTEKLSQEREGLLSERNELLLERDELNEEYTEKCQSLENERASIEQSYLRQQQEFSELSGQFHQVLDEKKYFESRLAAVHQSTSWRITRPIRLIKRFIAAPALRGIRRVAGAIFKLIWRLLPITKPAKTRLKTRLFTRHPALFKSSAAYQAWIATADASSAEYEQSKKHRSGYTAYEPVFTPRIETAELKSPPVKLIAFYLPQFHAIPENDAWWGKGFTEWTNVKPATPHFEGHYQPREPLDLGYYNLLDEETQRKQVELAKLYGIGGFCFYFYWFGGKRLLEAPTQQYLNNRELDLPFCLCWANENWSRRWDGLDSEILIEQHHSAEDDLAFIEHIASYLIDPRYIRIAGKPLLLVYRPNLLPNIRATARRWRNWCRENDIGEIYLAYTQSFDAAAPERYGFDAAIEFPPNNAAPPDITKAITPSQEEFSGTVYDWSVFVDRSEHYTTPEYKLFRSVCPSWDNTARRKNRGTVFVNNSPGGYQRWLENAVEDTTNRFSQPDERLVFVNAWNEWAEGAYLEPDTKYGYTYLQATRNALENTRTQAQRLLLVSHDAHPHGAQYLVLNLATQLNSIGFQVFILVLGEGELTAAYEKIGETKTYLGDGQDQALATYLRELFHARGVSSAIINSVASGHVAQAIRHAGFSSVGLVHELPQIISSMELEESAKELAAYTDQLIFPAEFVRSAFKTIVDVEFESILSPQGLYKKNKLIRNNSKHECRQLLRQQFGLAADTEIVLGVGGGDLRKGLDLFIEIAEAVIPKNNRIYFIWAGKILPDVKDRVDELLARSKQSDHIILTDGWVDTDLYYAGSDLYALTSREDPFPSVVLEAFDTGTPVVAFDECGGFTDIVSDHTGGLVPKFDVEGFASKILGILNDDVLRKQLASNVSQVVKTRFSFYKYAMDLINHAGTRCPKISVILPNYNYAELIAERIGNICRQCHPIYELIVLDDASTDASQEVIEGAVKDLDIPVTLLFSDSNSGSVFKQWRSGVEQAQGDLIWIAEADDIADPVFLARVSKGFENDPATVLSYCQSQQISGEGQLIADNYLSYTNDVCTDKWVTSYRNSGIDEIRDAFSIKNTIPNVSAVLFDAAALRRVLTDNSSELMQFKVAGDWLVYLEILKQGNIAFLAEALNKHRRHDASVTAELDAIQHLQEVRQLQLMAQNTVPPEPQTAEHADKYMDQLFDYFNVNISLDEFEKLEKAGPQNIRSSQV